MCIGVPMLILSSDGIAAQASDGDKVQTIDLSLTGPLEPGTWILTFLGTARDVLEETEALQIRRALDGLRSVMAGGDVGDAFADLDARTPQLPPHLQTALDNGETQA